MQKLRGDSHESDAQKTERECGAVTLARHRIALQKLRSELAEAQAKQKEASAAERLALQDGQGFKRLLTTSYSSALISGAIAGSTTEVILYPLDCLKTRRQSCCASPTRGLQLYRGCGIALAGAATASAVFFVTYECMKNRLRLGETSERSGKLSGLRFTCSVMGASVAGELAASVVRVPVDLMKQRLQTGCLALPLSSSIILASFQATALRDACQRLALRHWPSSGCLQYPLYECFKIAASKWVSQGDAEHLPVGVAAVCGSAAGLISATFTTPFDLLKTRVNLRRSKGDRTETKMKELLFDEVARVYRCNGWRGFFVGAGFRAAWMSLGGFVFLGSFELAKSSLDSMRTM
ncbi:unnamed protein product [Durusdinium trenchii]|uniref:Mitochondrial carrier protein n=1 Tax=Durusdinium trenchii TaxID=1381693 RepID=A0ABP0PG75_9DINO